MESSLVIHFRYVSLPLARNEQLESSMCPWRKLFPGHWNVKGRAEEMGIFVLIRAIINSLKNDKGIENVFNKKLHYE